MQVVNRKFPRRNSIFYLQLLTQIKLLVKTNLIICAFVHYIIKFQEKNPNPNRDWNQDSSMMEGQVRDLEILLRVPVWVRIFLLKYNNYLLLFIY